MKIFILSITQNLLLELQKIIHIIIFDLVETKKDLDKKFLVNWLKISESKIKDFKEFFIDNFPSVYGIAEKSREKI